MSLGMCLMKGPWALDVVCSTSNGNCDSGGNCICNTGNVHDMTFYRYRNCAVPQHHDTALYTLCFITSILAFLNSLRFIKESKSLARLILKAVLMIEASRCAFVISALAHGYGANTVSLFFIYLMVTLTSFCVRMTIYSLFLPLYKSSQKPKEQMEFIAKASFISLRTLQLIPVIASAWFYDQSNPANDYPWNICVSSFFALAGLEVLVVLPEMVYFGSKMIDVIQSLGEGEENKSSRKAKRNEYMNRVKTYLKLFIMLDIFTVLLFIFLTGAFFATKVVPYGFAFFDVIFYSVFIYSVMQVNYAVSKKVQISSTPEKPEISSGRNLIPSARITDVNSKPTEASAFMSQQKSGKDF